MWNQPYSSHSKLSTPFPMTMMIARLCLCLSSHPWQKCKTLFIERPQFPFQAEEEKIWDLIYIVCPQSIILYIFLGLCPGGGSEKVMYVGKHINWHFHICRKKFANCLMLMYILYIAATEAFIHCFASTDGTESKYPACSPQGFTLYFTQKKLRSCGSNFSSHYYQKILCTKWWIFFTAPSSHLGDWKWFFFVKLSLFKQGRLNV